MIQRVRGTNDYAPPADARLRALESVLRSEFEAFGYQGIQTPVLEPLELFLRKSGDDLLARMYAFSHWNRRLCLRPELTASVMRAYLNDLQGHSLPLRLSYSGPTFRYEKPQRGRYRQFTETGVELIGASGPASDAEVLYLACAGLRRAGVERFRLVVGHLAVVLELLRQVGMSEHAQSLLLGQMEPLARGRVAPNAVVARLVDLLGGPSNGRLYGEDPGLPEALANLPVDQGTAVAADILRRASLPIEGGVRRPQQIIQRLLSKASRPDPTGQVQAAVDFIMRLRSLAGPPDRLVEVRSLVAEHGLDATPLDEVQMALNMMRAHGPPGLEIECELDLSLARGLRYYTGLVFEIYVDTPDGPLQVCGGGRYDDLIRALGGRESVPACGFSYGLERVDMVRGTERAPIVHRIIVSAVQASDLPDALALADGLRSAGFVVEQDIRLRGPKAVLRHADRSGVAAVVLVGERERAEGTVVVRNMRSRTESRVPRQDLAATLEEALT